MRAVGRVVTVPHGVRFVDGIERDFDCVVLATGYRPAVASFLAPAADVLDAEGVPTASGAETLPGLYFCGFYVAPTGMLHEISREARRVARAILARKSDGLPSDPERLAERRHVDVSR